MKCYKCKNEVQDDINYCPICGFNLAEQKINEIVNIDKKMTVSKIVMGVVFTLFIVVCSYYLIIGMNSDLTVQGRWICADYVEKMNINNDGLYYYEFVFDKNMQFQQKSLDNSSKEFDIIGKYTFDLTENADVGIRAYLDVYLTTSRIEKEGVVDYNSQTSLYKFGMYKNGTNALVINTQSNSVYFCKRD